MDAVIERLRDEKAGNVSKWTELGKKEGITWAKTAHYNEIQFVLNWDITPSENKGWIQIPPGSPEGDAVQFYLDELFDHSSGTVWGDESTPGFIEAWHQAVLDFWEEVSPKL